MTTATPPAFDQFDPIEVPTTKWPKAIGIIGIVLGGLSGAVAMCGIIGTALVGWLAKMAEGQPAPTGGGPSPADAIAAMTKHSGLIITLSVVAIPIATLLVCGSMRLLKRRASSRKTLFIWSAVKVGEVIFGAWVGFLMAKEQMLVMKQMSQSGDDTNFAALVATVQLVGGVLIGLALPVFFAIWFSRQKIRDEMASWR